MKKLLLTICFVLCFNSVYAISTSDELIAHCDNSPEKIAKWISMNIEYKDDIDQWDKLDYYQSPTETLNLSSGDCEDYAILAYACLKKLGYRPKLLVMYSIKTAHCVCIFVYKGKWCYLGEEDLTYTDAWFSYLVMQSYNKEEHTNYIGYYFLEENEISLEEER